MAKKASYESLQRRIRDHKKNLEAKEKEKEKLERKLREWTIVNTLEALDSKFILTKALTKL